MKYFRRLYTSIRSLIVWFPVIWRDKQWDHWYLEVILLRKVRLMRAYHQRSNLFVGVETEIWWMQICERLLVNLTEGKYWEDEYDDKPINVRNAQIDSTLKEFGTAQNGGHAEIRETKARKLLYNIISWRSPYWWD